jgi:CHASE3 domain sensor protein
MRKLFRSIAALLLIAAALTSGYAARVYSRDKERAKTGYTQLIKQHDIVDAARNAFNALQDAEVREQNYVLTGETTYSEAYAHSIRDWQDEVGTLVLVAQNDPATPLAREMATAGDRTVKEIAAIMALYDEGAHEKALDRIHKSSGIVYLDQAHESMAKIIDLARIPYQANTTARLGTERRLVECIGALFGSTFVAAALLFFAVRPAAKPELNARFSAASA